jgi:hypothetical protein
VRLALALIALLAIGGCTLRYGCHGEATDQLRVGTPVFCGFEIEVEI